MHNQTVQKLAEYLEIVTQVDRTIYFRCRKAEDLEALAKGLASLLLGNSHIFLHSGNPLLPEEEDQMAKLLQAGETVLFMYPGDTRFPLEFAREWDSLQNMPTTDMKKPGFLAVVQVLDDEEPIPYEGSTRWIYEEEVEAIEAIGKNVHREVTRI
ncbi:MAG: hypothetical protein PVH61_13610 [Candidatus Aminicenantes bacterium]|jgi:hypothetical protein